MIIKRWFSGQELIDLLNTTPSELARWIKDEGLPAHEPETEKKVRHDYFSSPPLKSGQEEYHHLRAELSNLVHPNPGLRVISAIADLSDTKEDKKTRELQTLAQIIQVSNKLIKLVEKGVEAYRALPKPDDFEEYAWINLTPPENKDRHQKWNEMILNLHFMKEAVENFAREQNLVPEDWEGLTGEPKTKAQPYEVGHDRESKKKRDSSEQRKTTSGKRRRRNDELHTFIEKEADKLRQDNPDLDHIGIRNIIVDSYESRIKKVTKDPARTVGRWLSKYLS